LEGFAIESITPQHFSALTASSQLTMLNLVRIDDSVLPKGALQHMFPPGRQMPMQHLPIQAHSSEGTFFPPGGWSLDSADLLPIVQACPDLQALHIINSVQPYADLSPVLQLPRTCSLLDVGGAAFTDAAVPILLQLTQLEDLSWSQSTRFTDIGLEQLTQLNLTELVVERCSLGNATCPSETLELKWDPVLVSAASCWCCHALLTLCASVTSFGTSLQYLFGLLT
jgi:hypothetical protein